MNQFEFNPDCFDTSSSFDHPTAFNSGYVFNLTRQNYSVFERLTQPELMQRAGICNRS